MVTDKNQYTRTYFEGGNVDGSGYKDIGYQNYPIQLVVLDRILERKPESLLDVGGARGYIAKMFEQRTGKPGYCLDISEYCYATRVTSKFYLGDITNPDYFLNVNAPDIYPTSLAEKKIDLVFSIAVFEHIKEEDLPLVIKRISSVAKRGLICPSFVDVGEPDHTHESLHPKEWWEAQFAKYAPGWPVEIIDKEEMEKPAPIFHTPQTIPANGQNWVIAGRYVNEDIETLKGNNKNRAIVLNISSYIVMWRSSPEICVVNTDLPELTKSKGLEEFAGYWGSNFTTYKAPGKLPFATESISEINVSHMFEHLTREEGTEFLKECLRVLKEGGAIRIAVPNASLLAFEYAGDSGMKDIMMHGIYNVDVAKAEDPAQAFWHMITSGGEHKTAYDSIALEDKLINAGFSGSTPVYFDEFLNTKLIGQVGWDMYPESSLYVEAWKANKTPAKLGDHDVKVNLTEKDLKEAGLDDKQIQEFKEGVKKNELPKILEVTPERVSWTAPPPPYNKEDIQAGAPVKPEVHKICLIAPPLIPVNPDKYGGLERVVSSLGQGLALKGLDVTIVAPEGSEVKGCNIFSIGKPTGMQVNWIEEEKRASLLYKDLVENGNFDIIHDHTWFSRIYGLKKINPLVKICHTHHGHLNPSWVQYVKEITSTPNLIAISNWMKKLWLAQYQIFSKTAYNGVDTDVHFYDPNIDCSGNELLFVGRIDKLKRPDVAQDIAEKSGHFLNLLGSVDWSANKDYAEQVINRQKKTWGEGSLWLESTTAEKVKLMQRAKAVIVPSMFGEPFGLVVAEAMSCGAPVIALDDGGISEVIGDGYSFIADNPTEMVNIVNIYQALFL